MRQWMISCLALLGMAACVTASPPKSKEESSAMPQVPPSAAPNPPEVKQDQQKGQLSYGAIKSRLVKGKTTQMDIVKLFGSPNIVTKSAEKNEVWVYSKQSSSTSSQTQEDSAGDTQLRLNSFFGFYTAGNAADSRKRTVNSGAQSSVSSIDLIITFDRNDVMIDYSVVSSQF